MASHMSTYLKKDYKNIKIYMNEDIESLPTFCPVCGYALRNIEDKFSYSSYKCCNSCENKWVYLNPGEWKNGKRPTNDELEKYINEKVDIELNMTLKI
jgi:hypothetical protein